MTETSTTEPNACDDRPTGADPDSVEACTTGSDGCHDGRANADPSARELVAVAEAAVLSSGIDPGQAMTTAREALGTAEEADLVEPAVVALRAIALAFRELGDLQAAERHLRRAISLAGAAGLAERQAQARLSLVTVRTERGHPLQALRVAAIAWSYLAPLDRAKLDTQRAVALATLGRHQEATACCDRALAILAESPGTVDDLRFIAGGLLNRGLVNAYRGRWEPAIADIGSCLEAAQRAGLAHLARLAAANLPFLAVRQGDIPGAFARYRASADTLFGFPERLATMRADFAGALLAAHLPGEARELLRLATPDLESSGARSALADARLKLAQVELLAGDAHQASAVAEQARAELAAQDRDSWMPLAGEVTVRARVELEPASARLLRQVLGCVDDLAAHGHHSGAAALRLTAAELALALGDRETALAELDRITTDDDGDDGDFAPNDSYLTPNQSYLSPNQSDPAPDQSSSAPDQTSSAPDQTSSARDRDAGPTPEGASLYGSVVLTRLASQQQAEYMAADQPDEGIPAIIDRHAVALKAAIRGDAEAAYRAVLDGLAAVGAKVEPLEDPSHRAHAVKAGERLADLGLDLAIRGGDPETVFTWAERWRAVAATGSPTAPTLETVRAALGDTVLVEYVHHGDALLAVLLTRDRIRLRHLCQTSAAAEAILLLRYGLRRQALNDPTSDGSTSNRPTSNRSTSNGPDLVGAEGARVGDLLLGPFLAEIADRPLVIVPTGALHTLPWSALPALRERPVSVCPSADAWLTARASAPSEHGPLVVATAGPGLQHAGTEVERVLSCHTRTELVPASTGEVLGALGRADVLHLAAHGVFHARSPLLSAITLDDGELMAYDLPVLDRPPRLVILSACDGGMAHVPADGAPLGLAGTFLARGVDCVIAGLVPVRDEAALAVMTLFHQLLSSGTAPATALARACAATGNQGFTCFGAGDRPLTAAPRADSSPPAAPES